MEMNADFFYENFKNDANVIEGNIKDAINGNIDLAHLTAKEAKKIFREAKFSVMLSGLILKLNVSPVDNLNATRCKLLPFPNDCIN